MLHPKCARGKQHRGENFISTALLEQRERNHQQGEQKQLAKEQRDIQVELEARDTHVTVETEAFCASVHQNYD
jgi:hypothetical protein